MKIYNSMTRRKEEFVSSMKEKANIYVCIHYGFASRFHKCCDHHEPDTSHSLKRSDGDVKPIVELEQMLMTKHKGQREIGKFTAL